MFQHLQVQGRVERTLRSPPAFLQQLCNEISYWFETLAVPNLVNSEPLDFNKTENCPYMRERGSILGTFELQKEY